jgi:gluconate 5-dehydrogenase
MSLKMFDLTGRAAVVVGGAGGLGQAIAEGLAAAGAKVLISSRKTEA